MIVSVVKAAIRDHQRHFESLVRNQKVAILINGLNLNLVIVPRQYLLLILEELNELFGHNVGDLDLANVQRSAIPFPHHVMHEAVLLLVVIRHDRNLSFP